MTKIITVIFLLLSLLFYLIIVLIMMKMIIIIIVLINIIKIIKIRCAVSQELQPKTCLSPARLDRQCRRRCRPPSRHHHTYHIIISVFRIGKFWKIPFFHDQAPIYHFFPLRLTYTHTHTYTSHSFTHIHTHTH